MCGPYMNASVLAKNEVVVSPEAAPQTAAALRAKGAPGAEAVPALAVAVQAEGVEAGVEAAEDSRLVAAVGTAEAPAVGGVVLVLLLMLLLMAKTRMLLLLFLLLAKARMLLLRFPLVTAMMEICSAMPSLMSFLAS
mmetsp:Transcript_496/g.2151  ORF Transcript_496/g.2151 Transcript_496/m.2151 type:complete len:137 (+) Transcript_496:439-849(+)